MDNSVRVMEASAEPIAPEDALIRKGVPRVGLPALHLTHSERRLLLTVMDFVVVAGALIAAMALKAEWPVTPTVLLANFKWFVALAVVWWPLATLLESYDLARAASAPHSIISAGLAAGLTVAIYPWIPYFSPPLVARAMVFLFAALAIVAISAWRGLYAVIFVQPGFQQRALVVGAGWAGQALARELQGVPHKGNPLRGTGYELVAFVDDDPAKQAGGQLLGVPILGGCQNLPALAQKLQIDEVVLAITHRHTISDQTFNALLACREQGLSVTSMPALYERLFGRVPVEHIGHNLSFIFPADESPLARVYWAGKRVADILIAGCFMLVVGILAPIVWIANLVWSPGPLFYRQTRVGRRGRRFSILKFRTMYDNAEANTGAKWADKGDPRITPLGRWLRKMRLDELPQALNVLRGEMSIIGPRPERPEFIDELSKQIPFYRARHAVRPGITGWAQVRYGYGSSVADARAKLEYDLYYVRHAGPYLDTLIFLKTLAVIFKLQGR
jgi:exopolysaccharide biosynthesis polyprenyl glycosylphosphotransferase